MKEYRTLFRLEDKEYNVLGKLTRATGQDCWFDIREDEELNDYVYDLEYNEKLDLVSGLYLLFDGLVIDDYELLSPEEQEILFNLVEKVKEEYNKLKYGE